MSSSAGTTTPPAQGTVSGDTRDLRELPSPAPGSLAHSEPSEPSIGELESMLRRMSVSAASSSSAPWDYAGRQRHAALFVATSADLHDFFDWFMSFGTSIEDANYAIRCSRRYEFPANAVATTIAIGHISDLIRGLTRDDELPVGLRHLVSDRM